MPLPGWTEGLGELVRAHRKYCNVSQDTFARKMGIKPQSLSDIEIGRRDAPDGFILSCEKVVSTFDDEVERCIKQAEKMTQGDEEQAVNFRVTDRPADDWTRAVIGRAAVLGALIVPILETPTTVDGRHAQEARTG